MRNEQPIPDNFEEDAIRQQVNRILESQFFCQSRRLPPVLRFVVEHTLTGEVDEIKERTLGVELFARKPDYETATDPIVRVTVGEIRKRLAQYYLEPDHANELRITVPSGSYVPTFSTPEGPKGARPQSEESSLDSGNNQSVEPQREESFNLPLAGTSDARLDNPDPRENEPQTESVRGGIAEDRRRRLPRATAIIGIGIAAVAVFAATLFLLWRVHQSPNDFFWNPLFTGDDPVLIIIADQSQSDVALYNSGDPSQVLRYSNPANAFLMVALDNANVVARLIEPLALKHRRYLLKGEAATNLADLRSGPSILVGGFDNAWTLRMTNSLRFRFANTPGPWPSILDTASPSKVWKLVNDRSVGTYIDYAIVARFTADNTQRPTVVIAGLGRCASLAAGQFVTDSGSLAKLQHEAQSNGNKKNIEVVISTQVVDGQPGSPKIEAAYFW